MKLNAYELGYFSYEHDAWKCVVTDASPDEFIEQLRDGLAEVPVSHTEESHSRVREIYYSSCERIHMAMDHVQGVVISSCCQCVCSAYGGSYFDEEYDLFDLGSVENILAGGSWEEVAERKYKGE